MLDSMTKTTHDPETTQASKSRMPAPGAGDAIEPVTTSEDTPIVTEAAGVELLDSLERGENDYKAGRVRRMSGAELKAEMRADFERITGYEISREWNTLSIGFLNS